MSKVSNTKVHSISTREFRGTRDLSWFKFETQRNKKRTKILFNTCMVLIIQGVRKWNAFFWKCYCSKTVQHIDSNWCFLNSQHYIFWYSNLTFAKKKREIRKILIWKQWKIYIIKFFWNFLKKIFRFQIAFWVDLKRKKNFRKNFEKNFRKLAWMGKMDQNEPKLSNIAQKRLGYLTPDWAWPQMGSPSWTKIDQNW